MYVHVCAERKFYIKIALHLNCKKEFWILWMKIYIGDKLEMKNNFKFF